VSIDLHTHSRASDGTDEPAAVVAAATAAGLDVVALTDHDTTAGWEQAANAAREQQITLVPGAEISCQVGGISVHMLAYLHDPANPGLLAEMDHTRDDRVGRAQRIVTRLAEDFPLIWDDVLAQVDDRATVGRPHIADALVARGVVASRDEAFATLLNSRSPYYLPHYAPAASQIVRLVRSAGGVAVIAHCLARRRGRVLTDEDLAELAGAGMAGIEVDHRDHTDADREHLRAVAAGLGLLATGSSDYHGTGKINRIGENTTAPAVLEQIIEQGTPERVVRA
jgi:predicted metal-dependent phosphoesterase TrpH